MEVVSVFYMYGGQCIINNSCHEDIFYSDVGFSYKSRTIKCILYKEKCQITAKYTKVQMIKSNAEVNIQLKEDSSYSSSITINLTTSSSVPDSISRISTSINTGSSDTLFRGNNSTKFFYKFTPSVNFTQVFTSDSDQWPSKETGFHVSSLQDPQIGSLATQET